MVLQARLEATEHQEALKRWIAHLEGENSNLARAAKDEAAEKFRITQKVGAPLSPEDWGVPFEATVAPCASTLLLHSVWQAASTLLGSPESWGNNRIKRILGERYAGGHRSCHDCAALCNIPPTHMLASQLQNCQMLILAFSWVAVS